MNIGIDIDDTLSDLFAFKVKFATKYIKENHLPYKLVNKHGVLFSDIFDWPMEECDKFWYANADKMLSLVPPRKDVQAVLKKLRNDGHKLIIITARNAKWHTDPYKLSTDWLNKNNIIFDKLLIGHEDKLQACLDEKIDIFIDDSPKIIQKLNENNIKCVIMNNLHNQNLDLNYQRVYGWKDFYNFVSTFNNKQEINVCEK